MLVVLPIGLPGAGKSVVARHLAEHLDLHRICRDDIRAALFPRCAFTLTEKRAAFRAALLALEVNLALGRDTVLDGMTFSRRRDRLRVVSLCKRYGARCARVWLDVPPALARARIAADASRQAQRAADRDPRLVDDVLARFERPSPPIAMIDASLPASDVCEQALAIVRRKHRVV